jgi:hypothetical protein
MGPPRPRAEPVAPAPASVQEAVLPPSGRVELAPVSQSPSQRQAPAYDPAEAEDEAGWALEMEEEAARALGLDLDFE